MAHLHVTWRAAVPHLAHRHRPLLRVAAAPFATSTSSIAGAAQMFWSGETNKLADLLNTARAAHQSMLDDLEVSA